MLVAVQHTHHSSLSKMLHVIDEYIQCSVVTEINSCGLIVDESTDITMTQLRKCLYTA